METRHAIRLECLKLAHTHGREAPEVIARAKAYEGYVSPPSGAGQLEESRGSEDGPQSSEPVLYEPKRRGRPPKVTTDNA